MARYAHRQIAVMEALAERPYRFGELRQLMGVTDSQLFQTLQRLRASGRVERPEPGLYRVTNGGAK